LPLFLLFLGTAFATSVSITYPTDNLVNSGSYSVTWTSDGACWRVYESTDAINYQLLQETTSKSYSVSGKSDGVYYYRVSAYSDELCGENKVDSSAKSITIDTVKPTATSLTPANATTGVSTGAEIRVVFSEAMQDAATTGALSISPARAGTNVLSGGNTLIFTPSSDFSEGTTYTITISGAKDLAGNTADQIRFSFTTGVSTITSMSITAPKSGDDAIEESSLSAGVKLVGASSIPVAGAQVVASGACSGTLSDQGNGSYTGTCTVAKYGTSGTITFTATATNTMTKTVTIDIKKRAHLTMTVEAPKDHFLSRAFSGLRQGSLP
jgi:hypothetical protein